MDHKGMGTFWQAPLDWIITQLQGDLYPTVPYAVSQYYSKFPPYSYPLPICPDYIDWTIFRSVPILIFTSSGCGLMFTAEWTTRPSGRQTQPEYGEPYAAD